MTVPVGALFVEVVGDPAPQGSKQGFARGGKIVLVEMSKKVKPWRQQIAAEAAVAAAGAVPGDGPVEVRVEFRLRPPKRRWRTHPLGRPDVDKLARAVLDGLTGVAFVDDSQVLRLEVTKRYADPGEEPGATIHVLPVT